MKKITTTALVMSLFFANLFQLNAQRVTVSGNEFRVNNQKLWINGTNTPWDNWNDFGGNFDQNFWSSEFQRLENEKVNSTRVWLACSSEAPGVIIDSNGNISGITDDFWSDLDAIVDLAEKHKVYLMVSPLAHFQFDIFSTYEGALVNDDRYIKMIKDNAKVQKFIDNYLAPMVQRYKNRPYFMAIDIINEGEYLYDDTSGRYGTISRDQVLSFIAKCAKYVRSNSDILFTLGTGTGPKYQSEPISPNHNYFKNDFSDEVLGGYVSGAKLDFYNHHWYGWMDDYFPSPFNNNPDTYGISNKPVIIGECQANGNSGKTILQNYQHLHSQNYAGIMPWTSNGVDEADNGSLNDHKVGSNWIYDNFPNEVYPTGANNGGNDDETIWFHSANNISPWWFVQKGNVTVQNGKFLMNSNPKTIMVSGDIDIKGHNSLVVKFKSESTGQLESTDKLIVQYRLFANGSWGKWTTGKRRKGNAPYALKNFKLDNINADLLRLKLFVKVDAENEGYLIDQIAVISKGSSAKGADLDLYDISGLNTEATIAKMFPNPSKGDEVTFYLNGVDLDETFVVQIFDFAGKIILQEPVDADKEVNEITINLNGRLGSGMYHVVLSGKSQKIEKSLVVD